MGCAVDRGVEGPVGGGEVVGPVLHGAVAGDLVLHGGDLGLGRVLGGKGGRGAVEDLAHDIEFADRARLEFGDDHALVRLVDQQATGLEAAKRLANRRAAQPETLGEIGLLEAVAGTDRAFQDLGL